MSDVIVHDHALKHGLQEDEIVYAWEHFARKQYRCPPREEEVAAIGFDQRGRQIQMVGKDFGEAILIYHALTPPTEKLCRELGLKRRERYENRQRD